MSVVPSEMLLIYSNSFSNMYCDLKQLLKAMCKKCPETSQFESEVVIYVKVTWVACQTYQLYIFSIS